MISLETKIKYIDPKELIVNGMEYQREVEDSRLKRIRESVDQYGYWPWSVIVIDKENKVVDGQHRAVVAQQLDLPAIPTVKATSMNGKDNVKLFVDINMSVTALKPADFWYAQHLAGDPIGNFLYRLNSDGSSLLKNSIQLKGSSTNYKVGIRSALDIIFGAGLGRSERYSKRRHSSLAGHLKKANEIELIDKINRFWTFFTDCYGKDRRDNQTAFSMRTIEAFIAFYNTLMKHTNIYIARRDYPAAVGRMAKFVFVGNWNLIEKSAKVNLFIIHWNRNRKKNLLPHV